MEWRGRLVEELSRVVKRNDAVAIGSVITVCGKDFTSDCETIIVIGDGVNTHVRGIEIIVLDTVVGGRTWAGIGIGVLTPDTEFDRVEFIGELLVKIA